VFVIGGLSVLCGAAGTQAFGHARRIVQSTNFDSKPVAIRQATKRGSSCSRNPKFFVTG
jgi:hypothetical protein